MEKIKSYRKPMGIKKYIKSVRKRPGDLLAEIIGTAIAVAIIFFIISFFVKQISSFGSILQLSFIDMKDFISGSIPSVPLELTYASWWAKSIGTVCVVFLIVRVLFGPAKFYFLAGILIIVLFVLDADFSCSSNGCVLGLIWVPLILMLIHEFFQESGDAEDSVEDV